jgi:hypothetical protein
MNILDAIVEHKRIEVLKRKQKQSLSELATLLFTGGSAMPSICQYPVAGPVLLRNSSVNHPPGGPLIWKLIRWKWLKGTGQPELLP